MAKKQTKINQTNVTKAFQDGVILVTEIRCWGARATAEKDKFGAMMPKDIYRAVQDLLDPAAKSKLQGIRSIPGEVKSYISRYGLRTPVPNMKFFPKDRLVDADEYLQMKKGQFWDLVEDFCNGYEAEVEAYAKKYPEHYRPEKYPSLNTLRGRFEFKWWFRSFTVPDKEIGILSPAMYKAEQAKVKAEVEEMKTLTVAAIGNVLIQKVDNLVAQCENSSVQGATLKGFEDFLGKVDTMWDGYIASDKLQGMIEEVRRYLAGTDASMFNASEQFSDLVKDRFKEVADDLSKLEGVKLKRKIKL